MDDYIAGLGDWRGDAVAEVRRIVRGAAPDVEEAIKWSQPVFSSNGPFCFVKAHRSHVNFGFWRGATMDAPAGLLTGSGQMMAHIKIKSMSDIQPDVFAALVREAVALNARHGDPSS